MKDSQFFLTNFKNYLFSQNPPPSLLTVKNYLADVQKFLTWYENYFSHTFLAEKFTTQTLTLYRKSFLDPVTNKETVSLRSIERYFSSLRKFATGLASDNFITENPFDELATASRTPNDPWNIKQFKNYLYEAKASDLTIKNYIIDIQHFLSWVTKMTELNVNQKVGFEGLSSQLIEEYKLRLLDTLRLSPVSINRKLSSIRKYISWANQEGYLSLVPQITSITPELNQQRITLKSLTVPPEKPEASEPELPEIAMPINRPFSKAPTRVISPFLRLGLKASQSALLVWDGVVTLPLTRLFLTSHELAWRLTGQKLFIGSEAGKTAGTLIKNLPKTYHLPAQNPFEAYIVGSKGKEKDFYAPLSVITTHFPLHKKALHHIRFTRPKWYKRYHSYAFAHHMHFAVMVIAMVFAGNTLYTSLVGANETSQQYMALPVSSARVLTFAGKFTDEARMPLVESTNVRFAVYTDRYASGSALLWQEVQSINPDSDGSFSVILGAHNAIPATVLQDTGSLFLGISIGAGQELSPREQLANVTYASTAESIQGLLPISNAGAGEKNVLLALDSAGDLIISGNASPTFQATGGILTLSGEGLNLQTNKGSHADIVLNPDGDGKVDFLRPIHNTSEYSSIVGAKSTVDILDSVSIIASDSGQSALYINQNGVGSLISASSSGTAKFTVDLFGAGTFADDLAVEGGDITTNRTHFTIANSNAIDISLGAQATGIAIGSNKGRTTIHNAITELEGDLYVDGKEGGIFTAENAGLSFSGNGQHTIEAMGGTLSLGTNILSGTMKLAKDIDILPELTEGTNDLGSADRPFDTLYVQNVVASNNNGVASHWQLANNTLFPTQTGYDLIVGGNASNSAEIQLIASGSDAGTINLTGKLQFQTTNGGIVQYNGGDISFSTSPGNSGLTERVRITNNGSQALIVNGTALIDGVSVPSDAQLKKDISAFTDGLSVLEKINPVQYFYNGKAGTHKDQLGIGIIAQDVKDIIPYTISTFKARLNPDDPYETELLSFNSSALTFVTINAIKELDQKLSLEQQQNHIVVKKTDSIVLDTSGEFLLDQQPDATYVLRDAQGNIVHSVAGFFKGAFAYLHVGFTQTRELVVTGSAQIMGALKATSIDTESLTAQTVAIASDNVSIAGKNIRHYIESVIDEYVPTLRVQLASPITVADRISTSLLSPLSQNANIALRLDENTLSITNDKNGSGSAIATIDRAGNASFSGTLLSEAISTNTATVSGSLAAGAITTDSLNLSAEALAKLKDQLGSSAATYVTNITNVYSASAAATPTPTPIDHIYNSIDSNQQQATDGEITVITPDTTTLSETVTSDFADIASMAARFQYVPDLKAEFLEVSKGLISFGPASFADIATAGQLSVGGNMILADNTINVLNADLELQPLRQGGVRIAGGMVIISAEGDLQVNGNAYFAKDVSVNGTLAAHVIKPISDQLVITNASGSGVLAVNQL
jgi:site-specific recombinase XerD